jgi:hypothetical protein
LEENNVNVFSEETQPMVAGIAFISLVGLTIWSTSYYHRPLKIVTLPEFQHPATKNALSKKERHKKTFREWSESIQRRD